MILNCSRDDRGEEIGQISDEFGEPRRFPERLPHRPASYEVAAKNDDGPRWDAGHVSTCASAAEVVATTFIRLAGSYRQRRDRSLVGTSIGSYRRAAR
jgi:hypothetical protein